MAMRWYETGIATFFAIIAMVAVATGDENALLAVLFSAMVFAHLFLANIRSLADEVHDLVVETRKLREAQEATLKDSKTWIE